MIIENARIVLADRIADGCVRIKGAKIAEVAAHMDGEDRFDAQGMYLTPGFIDLHVHGGGGRSVMSGRSEDVAAMARAHLADGTTTILPTTLAAPEDQLNAAIDAVSEAARTVPQIAGIHLEGPFLSPAQSGAQAPGAIRLPDVAEAERLLDRKKGLVKMMGAAPELEGALAVGDLLAREGVIGSMAHTDAAYDDVRRAADHGFSDVTHLFSCTSTIRRVNGYRIPGVVEAALLMDGLTTQFIGDLRHLPCELIRLILKAKGTKNAYLVTDGLEFSAAKLEEGTRYVQYNGMETVYEDEVMKLPDRQAFAGSVATMRKMVRNLVKTAGISLCDAVTLASATPARRLGLRAKGAVAAGSDADLVLLDADLQTKAVISGGIIVK